MPRGRPDTGLRPDPMDRTDSGQTQGPALMVPLPEASIDSSL